MRTAKLDILISSVCYLEYLVLELLKIATTVQTDLQIGAAGAQLSQNGNDFLNFVNWQVF